MQSLTAFAKVCMANYSMVRILSVLTVITLMTVGFFVWKAKTNPAFPTSFDLQFAATGLVEKVDYKADTCTVKIAVYDWINLSPGFELSEIPNRSDRYYLRGQGEACQALTVALATTEQHIGFQVGRSGKDWYFVDNPSSAAGCGGMKIDWVPESEES
jgi:hypothetical protein